MEFKWRGKTLYRIDTPPPGSVAEKIQQARGHRSRPATAREIRHVIQEESSRKGPLPIALRRLWRLVERAARRRERGH